MSQGIVSDWTGNRRVVDIEPVQLDTLSSEQAPTVVHVRTERNRRRYPGRISTGLGFDADLRNPLDGENLHGLGSIGTALKSRGEARAVVWFRCADNQDHMLTPHQAIDLGLRYGAYVTALARAKGAVEAKLDAGFITTIDQLRDAPEWPDPMQLT